MAHRWRTTDRGAAAGSEGYTVRIRLVALGAAVRRARTVTGVRSRSGLSGNIFKNTLRRKPLVQDRTGQPYSIPMAPHGGSRPPPVKEVADASLECCWTGGSRSTLGSGLRAGKRPPRGLRLSGLRASGDRSTPAGRRLRRMLDIGILGIDAPEYDFVVWVTMVVLAGSLRPFWAFRLLYAFPGAALSGTGAGSIQRYSRDGTAGRRCPCRRADDTHRDDGVPDPHEPARSLGMTSQRLLSRRGTVPRRSPAPRARSARRPQRRPAGRPAAVCPGSPTMSSAASWRRACRPPAAARRPPTQRFLGALADAGRRPAPDSSGHAGRLRSVIREGQRRRAVLGRSQGAPITQ